MKNIGLLSILFSLFSSVIGHPTVPADIVKRNDEDDWESPVYKQIFRTNHYKSLGQIITTHY